MKFFATLDYKSANIQMNCPKAPSCRNTWNYWNKQYRTTHIIGFGVIEGGSISLIDTPHNSDHIQRRNCRFFCNCFIFQCFDDAKN